MESDQQEERSGPDIGDTQSLEICHSGLDIADTHNNESCPHEEQAVPDILHQTEHVNQINIDRNNTTDEELQIVNETGLENETSSEPDQDSVDETGSTDPESVPEIEKNHLQAPTVFIPSEGSTEPEEVYELDPTTARRVFMIGLIHIIVGEIALVVSGAGLVIQIRHGQDWMFSICTGIWGFFLFFTCGVYGVLSRNKPSPCVFIGHFVSAMFACITAMFLIAQSATDIPYIIQDMDNNTNVSGSTYTIAVCMDGILIVCGILLLLASVGGLLLSRKSVCKCVANPRPVLEPPQYSMDPAIPVAPPPYTVSDGSFAYTRFT